MAGATERVMALEAKVQEHSESFQLLREDIADLGTRIDRVEQRMDRVEQRIDRLDDKLDRGFMWLVGLQVGVLAAVVTGFVAVMGQLVAR